MSSLEDISSVTLVLTSGCNLTCSYCFQNAKSGRRMTWSTAHRAIDTLLASREDEVELAFYGGEPLIQLDLIRRAVRFVESNRRPDLKVGYSTITNGTLIAEEEAEFLAVHNFKVQLSIDGVPAVQSLRGEGTFEILDALLDRLSRDHRRWFADRITVSATVLPTTVGHLADSVEYFLDKGVEAIQFSPGAMDTSSWRLEQIDELEEQFERIFDMTLRHYRRTGQIAVECLRSSAEPRRRVQPHAMCNVESAEELTVDVDGDVYGCAMFAESFQEFPSDFLSSRMSNLRLGELSEPDLSNRMTSYSDVVTQAEIFHNRDEKHSGYAECRSCEFLDHCFVCPVTIGQIPGNTDPHRIPDFLCAFNLVSNRFREKLAGEPGWLQWIKDVAEQRPAGSEEP